MNRDVAKRLDALLASAARSNPFYREKLEATGWASERPPLAEDLGRLPFTTKQELVADHAAHPPFGSNLTHAPTAYARCHQTSGTSGRPLLWLDDEAGWNWLIECWRDVYRGAGVTPADRVLVAASFGPLIGFWAGFEAGQRQGCMMISGGGMNTAQRIEIISRLEPTVLLCTPTYALRLADGGREAGVDLARSSIRKTIHGGEPGASVPEIRARIEKALGARAFDHAGATEVGAWGFPCEHQALHVNEDEFIVEVVDPESGDAIPDDASRGELVLTNLGRQASPVIRYRTGDAVQLSREPCPCGNRSAVLVGGLIGRVDDMVVVRGVNVFPSAVEAIVWSVPGVDEFECVISRDPMAEVHVCVEGSSEAVGALERAFRHRLGLRVTVTCAAPGSLPRYEAKARRFRIREP